MSETTHTQADRLAEQINEVMRLANAYAVACVDFEKASVAYAVAHELRATMLCAEKALQASVAALAKQKASPEAQGMQSVDCGGVRPIYVEESRVDAKTIVSALQAGDLSPEDAAEWIDKLVKHNATPPSAPQADNELPGMWERADFTGGSTDCAPQAAGVVETTTFEIWLSAHKISDTSGAKLPLYHKEDMRDAYWAGCCERHGDMIAALDSAVVGEQATGGEFCCEHSWSAAKQLAWKERNTNCGCDHNESCLRCFPAEFRAGGRFHTYAPATKPAQAEPMSDDDWLDLAQRHVNADWNSDQPDGFLNAVKAVCKDFAEAGIKVKT